MQERVVVGKLFTRHFELEILLAVFHLARMSVGHEGDIDGFPVREPAEKSLDEFLSADLRRQLELSFGQ